jgi:hypothetical protein
MRFIWLQSITVSLLFFTAFETKQIKKMSSPGTWIARGFWIALGFLLFQIVFFVLVLLILILIGIELDQYMGGL